MIGWIYSDPSNVCCGNWRHERGTKILCAPLRPANATKRSGFVNYIIVRGQSFNEQVN